MFCLLCVAATAMLVSGLATKSEKIVSDEKVCAGEFQRCSSTGECVLIGEDCGVCTSCKPGQYLCPSRTRCEDDFATCPDIPGTFWDWTLPLDTRVEMLWNLTNVTEQILQLTNEAPAIRRLYVPEYNWLNDDLHGLRRHRATSFPNGVSMGLSWSRETVKAIGNAIAEEARALHHWFIERGDRAESGYNNGEGLTIYGPNVNLVRDPRWGRNQEVYSEDPYLSGVLVKDYVEGMQSTGNGYMKAAACCKHYAVYDVESFPTQRYFYDAIVDGRNLWESYLPVFEMCVKDAGAAHVMCSYNAINGIPACAQEAMLNGILRDRWNWTGFVVSDYDAWAQIFQTHRYCPNMTCAAWTGLNAGMDQEGGGSQAIDKLPEALAMGKVTADRIGQAFRRLFRVRFQLGMFDPPSMVPFAALPFSTIDDEAHIELSLRGAQESIVLVQNQGSTLPLNESRFGPQGSAKIAVIGPNGAATSWLQGNYAESPAWGVVSILEGIMNASCGADTFCNFDTSGVAYNNDNDTYVTATSAGDCCGKCRELLNCNYFTFHGDTNRCFILRNPWNRQVTPSGSVISGARPGLAIMQKGVSYVAPGDLSVHSHDERECSQRCRADPNCQSFSYHISLKRHHTCFFNPSGNATMDPMFISGASPPKCSTVTFAAACAGGMQCRKPYGFDDAVVAAQSADAVVLVLGLDQNLESEGNDRQTIDLPENQYLLANRIAEATVARQTPVICVFVHGGTFAPKGLSQQCTAILDVGYPSMQGGNAIAQALLGWYNPGGKTAATWYSDNADLPPNLAFQDFYPNATNGTLGYTYRYFTKAPAIPFGYGLSYTTFHYSNFTAPATVDPCDSASVSVTVTNTGPRDGDEVVQLYYKQNSSHPVPTIRLVDFVRIHLQAGESKVVNVKADAKFRSTVMPNSEDPILKTQIFGEKGTGTLFVGGGLPFATQTLQSEIVVTRSENLANC
jgi:beta-glucosidase